MITDGEFNHKTNYRHYTKQVKVGEATGDEEVILNPAQAKKTANQSSYKESYLNHLKEKLKEVSNG